MVICKEIDDYLKYVKEHPKWIEVTMKISIPQYKQVNSKCICVIDGAQHEIYNVAHVTTKDGFKETELTLKTPAYDREVYDDETGTQ